MEHWQEYKVYTIKEARMVIKDLYKKEMRAIRLIKFGFEEGQPVPYILDIVEMAVHPNIKRYPYGGIVDSFMKEWCKEKAPFSFEIVA